MSITSESSSIDRAYSAFLALPTELRCHIYDFLLADSQAVTISAGYVTIFGNRIQDRARKTEIPGLPLDFAPIVRRHYDASLLSVANPPEIPIDNGWMSEVGEGKLGYPAPLALLQTSRLVNDELQDYMNKKKAIAQAQTSDESEDDEEEEDEEGLSLYVTYPYGVLVLKSMYPFLLKQAKRVYITGYYSSPKDAEPEIEERHEASDEELLTNSVEDSESFGPRRIRSFVRLAAGRTRSSTSPTSRPRLRLCGAHRSHQSSIPEIKTLFPSFSSKTMAHAPDALAHLVRTLLPPSPTQLVKLSARIVYPGEYKFVWSDDSPVTHIMRSICGGKIDMQVKRSSIGTGLYLVARPKTDGRMISTSWVNWRVSPEKRGGVDVEDLDGFLIEE
ncbi:hypothetical protein P153DRAFT_367176 [Dothidotthia symphoricarpi CBS 119687]|uniref:Uncharacterized protein n=1 Tax=Dothidotthia symphoricarpi CBS 119687 TaxID=1392245 RepID=A0A6A6AD47_9PLEO|nr:uncharacterized protein P153DRAFT_367176 [Dothidotthia symphoricarpi CBS 119687]KAF2128848.1 hypothetical protein P153DRAFT_367176 [Dothidotthia symphoricarpi CBS 119687]